ncbi:hypothetical protein H4R33_002482 [Dimargaris cristalligena]|nr:hypothetical protein H4R33_002482 [Dimargaris cristalligena]
MSLVIDLTGDDEEPQSTESPVREPRPSTPSLSRTRSEEPTAIAKRQKLTRSDSSISTGGTTDPPALKQYYLDTFQTNLNTVLDGEQYLLNETELTYCSLFNSLSIPAQYLAVRLFLRKPDWTRQSQINYPEITDMAAVVEELSSTTLPILLRGECEITSLEAHLQLLTLEELRTVCKPADTKTKLAKTRSGLIEQYVKLSRSQRTLSFFKPRKAPSPSPTSSSSNSPASQPSDTPLDRQSPWHAKVLKLLGPVVRLSPAVVEAFKRIVFIYHRRIEPFDSNSMTTSVMASIGRWNYPRYEVTRSHDLFADRNAYLLYEKFSHLQHDLYALVESDKTNSAVLLQVWETCQACLESWQICVAIEASLVTTATPPDPSNSATSITAADLNPGTPPTLPRLAYYKRRFTVGWVYTRILDFGTKVLAGLKLHQRECELIRQLLDQQVFCLGKRGPWYERLALIQTNYLADKGDPPERKTVAWQACRTTCLEGLQDPHSRQAVKSRLAKRLIRIEKGLELLPDKLYQGPGYELKEAPTITITGVRGGSHKNRPVYELESGEVCAVELLALDYYQRQGYRGFFSFYKAIYAWCDIPKLLIFIPFLIIMANIANPTRLHYRELQFGLLFWDILFAPYPGMFETPYQTHPLDLNTDAFYIDRATEIEAHLTVIETDYTDLIQRVWIAEQPRATRCIGVDWSFELSDLLEIAEAMGGKALVGICRNLARDYRHNRSGLPDLGIWNSENKTFKAVEVKGPGDTLSETQKTWIDILLTLGLDVELCIVKAAKDTPPQE